MNNLKPWVAICGVVLLLFSCTDLIEKPYSEAQPKDFFVNDKSLEATLIPAYAALRPYTWNYWNATQCSSDETRIIFREGFLGLIQLNFHIFNAGNEIFLGLWQDLFDGVGKCNIALSVVSEASDKLPSKTRTLAELRTLRAFYYFLLVDTFGNVPIVTATGTIPPQAGQDTRKTVFEFCIRELEAVVHDLPLDAPVGRVSRGVANAILTKLYLNAEVFAGVPRWNECIKAADAVLASNKYSLETNYFDNFRLNNSDSKEAIFTIQFDSKTDLGFPNQNFYMRTLHYNQAPASPWNGFCTIAEFYDGFAQNDPRRQVLWFGKQFENLTWPQAQTTGKALTTRNGQPLFFTKEVFPLNSSENMGVRVVKYEPDVLAPGGQGDNDYLIFRLSDMMLAKAEALFRIGRRDEALSLINTIRRRAFKNTQDADLKTIALKDIYNERGFELFWEGFRRQDMIRFGTFWDAYTSKPNTQSSRTKTLLFPIPTQILANFPNFKQNSGY